MDDFEQISQDYYEFNEVSKTRCFSCYKCGTKFFIEFDPGRWNVVCINESCKEANVVEM